MNVLIQIGRKKKNNWSHGISARLLLPDSSEEEISWEKQKGQWITPPSSRLWDTFFMAEVSVETGDKIVINTYARNNLGLIEKLCLKETYMVDESFEVKDFTIEKICCKGFPLIKGRIEKVISFSKENERNSKIQYKIDYTSF
jgi:hypothetical protein